VKILLVSDLHYALKQFDWTAEAASNFDLVIVAGDHIDIAGQLDGRVQTVVILKYFRRFAAATRVIVSSGNHDLDRRDKDGEKIAAWMRQVQALGIAVDGQSREYSDALISVCPWWDGPIAKEKVGAQLERDAALNKRPWYWVYHAPPEGSPTSWNGKRAYGDAELTAWIGRYKPDIIFAGHIHEAPFKKDGSWVDRIGDTWIFNSGRQIGPTPTHIIIDTQAREAVWFSMAGDEIVNLDAPLERRELTELPAWFNIPVRGPSLG
jgi:Icc-related predicted phosphoesterase